MTSVVATALLLVPAASAAGEEGARAKPQVRQGQACLSARNGLAFYARRMLRWHDKLGARLGHVQPARLTTHKGGRPCSRIQRAAEIARWLAYRARYRYEQWVAQRRLIDTRVEPGNHAWKAAVEQAQRPYPDTEDWLMACSADEGGHGRWVPNSEGGTPGGWLQFKPSTFERMFAAAKADVESRGYEVPKSAASWYSALGQALAGAWGVTNGRRHEWSGADC